MTFYDYDMAIQRDGSELYMLRAQMKRLPDGGYCRVYPQGDSWVRKTNWLAKWSGGGTRYEMYESLDDALTAGIKWARRRERQDQKEKMA